MRFSRHSDENSQKKRQTAASEDSQWLVPFHQHYIAGREQEYVADAIATGARSQSEHADSCQAWLGQQTGKKALLTPSCSAALEMAAIVADVGPGDEVIVPSFTFTTSASAFALFGAQIVFVDIQPDTLNIDPEAVAAAITPRTRWPAHLVFWLQGSSGLSRLLGDRVIVVVHYAGVSCDMDTIMEIAAHHPRILVVEDCAHAILATGKDGKPLGSSGHLAAFSFHHTKNISCGEGGALCVNRDCADLWPRARVVWEKGTNRQPPYQIRGGGHLLADPISMTDSFGSQGRFLAGSDRQIRLD